MKRAQFHFKRILYISIHLYFQTTFLVVSNEFLVTGGLEVFVVCCCCDVSFKFTIDFLIFSNKAQIPRLASSMCND